MFCVRLAVSYWPLVWLTLRPWTWRQYVPSKHQCTSTELHGVTSQKSILFTAVRTSNPKSYCYFPSSFLAIQVTILQMIFSSKYTLLAPSIVLIYIYPKIKYIWNWSQNLHLQSRETHEISANTLADRRNGGTARSTCRQEKGGTWGLQWIYKRPLFASKPEREQSCKEIKRVCARGRWRLLNPADIFWSSRWTQIKYWTGDLPHMEQRGILEPYNDLCRKKYLERRDFEQNIQVYRRRYRYH
jgi:hypothetical protein